MTVVYYTSTYFLDISLEVINVLKKHVDLHVFVEITSSSKNMTVADVDKLPADKMLATPAEILNAKSLAYVEPYFAGTSSVHFVIHAHQSGFSFSTIKASLAVRNFVKNYKPNIIHFEGYTLRTIGLLPYLLKFKKVFMAIHDPIPHSGEHSWKISLPNFLFFYLPFKKYFLFYSSFARNMFIGHYTKVKQPKLLVPMQPFYAYRSLVPDTPKVKEHILFFGRISPYKGIDVLMEAMPTILKHFPNERLVVAGKAVNGYHIDDNVLEKHRDNVVIYNRYIPNDELMSLIGTAKLVVCPYLDATQSGVLMTAFALNTPVVASRVGSFPEFVEEGYNGMLTEPGDAGMLADKIVTCLKDDFYLNMQQNIMHDNNQNKWEQSLATVLNEYELS